MKQFDWVVTFRKEESKSRQLALFETNVIGNRVEVDTGRHGNMLGSAQIQSEYPINKHPNIIIARKVKYLAALVSKVSVKLKRKMIVMSVTFVPIKAVIDWKKRLYRIRRYWGSIRNCSMRVLAGCSYSFPEHPGTTERTFPENR